MIPIRTNPLQVTLTAAVLACVAGAQMEKRTTGLYDLDAFMKAFPAVGTETPDLQLPDLLGRPRSLRGMLGRHVVLLKGSYT